MSASTDRRTPSPAAPHVRIKSEYVAAEDYMNEVQDLRRRSVENAADSSPKRQENSGLLTRTATPHHVSERAATPVVSERSDVEAPGEGRHAGGSSDSEEPKTALNLHVNGNSRQAAERGYAQHTQMHDENHQEKTTALNLVNGNSRLSSQINRTTPPPPAIHLHIDPQDRPSSRHNESPVGLMVQGLSRRDSSSRDEMLDDDRYSPVPETSDCHTKSDEATTQANSEAFQPCRDRQGNLILDVDCGSNSAYLYINKLCQGSKGQSIYFNGKWFTPNEFQYISGRETAKDWKRSIRHRGKSLKILMSRGLLSVHTSAASECSNCKMNMAMTRVRYSDKRPASTSSLLTVPSSTTMTPILDKSAHRRSVGNEPESSTSQLNQIINQLHQTQTNGYSDSRKRSLILESISGDMKRPRSLSPSDDDIYEEQQRSIFQAANSPEPQIIENVRRSLNISTADDVGSSPPSPASLSPPSLEDQVNTGPPDGDFIVRSTQSLSKHLSKSSRKQISPQHIDLLTTADRENTRSPHIMLSTTGNTTNSSSSYQKQAVLRQRFHSQAFNLSRHSSPNETANSRRTQSLVTPSAKSSDTPMIELTRPDLVNASNTTSASERSRVSGVTSTSQVAEDGTVTVASSRLSPSDQVFFPADMSSWMVDDVVQFVQSLKGCEEYAQFFRDQAIDGEILPVLTEDHLLQNMGMKLGPALKIRLHIAKRLGYTLNGQYCSLKTPYEEQDLRKSPLLKALEIFRS